MIQQLQQHEPYLSSVNATDPVLLCAADDNYTKPLAVTLHSAATHLRAGAQLNVLMMDGGLSDKSWAGLRESLHGLPINITVLRPDHSVVEDLVTSHHITHTAYFRLLAAELLPDDIDKVIYLDSDVLVQDDLCTLWEEDLEGSYCLAVPDIACPFVDSRQADSNFKKSSPYLAALAPVQNWEELGLDPALPYFNSGVMVINLARWRAENIHERLLKVLRDNEQFVWCWDQYALNVVFSGQWRPLPLRWNQGAHVFEYPDASYNPLDPVAFQEMRDNPAIIHYTTEWKPWHFRPFHPLRDKFLDYLDNTAWKGWRPEKPEFTFEDWWSNFAVGVIKRATISYRKVASVFR